MAEFHFSVQVLCFLAHCHAIVCCCSPPVSFGTRRTDPSDLTCPLPRSNLLGWFQAANLQGWSLPASSVQSWPRPNPPTPEQTQTCTWLHHAEQYITVGKPKALWLSESLKYRVVMCTVGGSHHRYDWSRAHVADQFPEERLTPQVQVVFPKKLLRCLTHKTDTFN